MDQFKSIRKLQKSDMPRMLEWMQDEAVTCQFKTEFCRFTEADVHGFIVNSFTEMTKHFAVVNDDNQYCGTISLKNISKQDSNAEFAIVMRLDTQGSGLALQASKEILQYAFKELGLNRIYLNVLSDNGKAKHFYEKLGFQKEGCFKKHICINGVFRDLDWYGILKEDFTL